uniref:Uncharacterized protein n=1 Tax=Noctiluca scintillans TaxID=2966 RepID=A0A7S0ZTH9_NOCSC|mmetsp:Transcript_18248/g.49043  ORF Transcript_18248/g.49043 Transcript_18248/m.49043 type:complete len:199 (+) Transcript_18248:88-684(+)
MWSRAWSCILLWACAPVVGVVVEEETSIADSDVQEGNEAIKDLTSIVFKLIVESVPARKIILKSLNSMERRVTAMEEALSALNSELDGKSGHDAGESYRTLQNELLGIVSGRDDAMQRHSQQLDTIHEGLKLVSSASAQPDLDAHIERLSNVSQRALNHAVAEHERSFGITFGALVFIGIGGILLYSKFRAWEKKHVL